MLTDRMIVNQVHNLFDEKGYAFFFKGDYNLNIIGVRGENRDANKFDDSLLCIYKINGEWVVDDYTITTDAGTHWLENPMNKKGCAILKCNQYRGCYKLGLHRGEYMALVQKGKVEVYRDNNKDNFLDLDESTLDEGYFGINIHRSNPRTESKSVDKWSAGCQVFQKKSSYDKFIGTCLKASDLWGDKFTYTLINEKELI
tara:strand:- start:2723 stop:3322 length:600 start_codon:yes stop_codon:yes gene_type:complete